MSRMEIDEEMGKYFGNFFFFLGPVPRNYWIVEIFFFYTYKRDIIQAEVFLVYTLYIVVYIAFQLQEVRKGEDFPGERERKR